MRGYVVGDVRWGTRPPEGATHAWYHCRDRCPGAPVRAAQGALQHLLRII